MREVDDEVFIYGKVEKLFSIKNDLVQEGYACSAPCIKSSIGIIIPARVIKLYIISC